MHSAMTDFDPLRNVTASALPLWLRLIRHLRDNFRRVTAPLIYADQSILLIVRNRIDTIKGSTAYLWSATDDKSCRWCGNSNAPIFVIGSTCSPRLRATAALA